MADGTRKTSGKKGVIKADLVSSATFVRAGKMPTPQEDYKPLPIRINGAQ
jgi:hypothetical protein